SPQREAWQGLQKTYEPMKFVLDQSTAQQALARLHAEYAATLLARVALAEYLQPILKDDLPGGLAVVTLAPDAAQAHQRAMELYSAADEGYTQVVESTAPQSLQGAARVGQIFVRYAMAVAARLSGDKLNADQYLHSAISVRDAAIAAGV